jgi:fructokinase
MSSPVADSAGTAGPGATRAAPEGGALYAEAGEALMDVYPAGATDDGLRLDARMGGSPFNVALALARLGQPVAYLGVLSTDLFGERLLRRLKQEGVDVERVQRLDAPTTLAIVGVDQHGLPSYAFHGAGAADRQLSAVEAPAQARVLHLGSLATVAEPAASTLQALVQREHGRRLVAYDPNVRPQAEPDLARWRSAFESLLPVVHLLKLSEEDAALLAPGVAPEALAGRCLAHGVSLVVITRGAKGARAWNALGHVQVRAAPAMLVDTVGAGDAFPAALLCWLAEAGLLKASALAGLMPVQLERALEFACHAAALACSRRGADAPRRHEL